MATEKSKSGIKGDILTRVRVLYVLFIFVGVAIIARIVWLQFGPQGDDLRKMAVSSTFERVKVEAIRGDILARDGRILATSVPTYELRMDFAAAGLVDSIFNKGVDSLAYRMSVLFKDRSQASYKNMLVQARKDRAKNRYKLISPRRVSLLELKDIKNFPIFRLGPNKGGLITTQVNKRTLPHGSLAARTIGMVNQEGVKLGIEGAFDEYLKGKDGNVLKQRISGSFRVPVSDELNVEPVDGIDVVTTLDVDIQDVAESALKKQLDLGRANWGTVILMEVATGEIRAMANITRKSEGVFVEDYNYAIGMSLEPGSTFKLASLLALVEDGKMSLDHQINTEGGKAWIGKKLVVDDHKEGVLSLRKVFEVSSNIGFAKAINEVYAKNPTRFVDYISSMGLDKPMGMQIGGEQTPTVWKPGSRWWDGTTLTMMSYGYALRLTPLHTLSLYNAVANNGKMVRPLLVKEMKQYGNTVRKYDTEVVNPAICSGETLEKVRSCLEGVVEEGTAKILKSPYYKVAGKTGTAQIAQGRSGYTDAHGGRHYLATLVGYFPADNPKYSCIVQVKTYYGQGSYGTYYGSSLAGPVFKAIADRVYASNTQWQSSVAANKGEKVVEQPPLKGGNIKEVKKVANKLSLSLHGDNSDGKWVLTKPDSTFTEIIDVDMTPGIVPSVKGMGLKEAIFLLERTGLKVGFRGRGKVVSQSIEPGAKAVRGEFVAIVLE